MPASKLYWLGCAAGAALLSASLAHAQDGQAAYNANCLSCHQTDGRGVPGVFPDLTESPLLAGEAGPLLRYMLYQEKPEGFEGSGGFAAMPQFDYLDDATLAALLTFAREEFAGGAGAIGAEDVAAARD
ncbi:MAG: hypothetical protein Tsb0010_12060 [Parvularculaceae bacterium]